jgi:tRNA(Ile)-lysidine synthase
MLDAVAAVLPPTSVRLVVVHVDHQLRPSSTKDAEHVGRIAKAMDRAWTTMAVNVPELAARERRGIEEAARIGRYRALRAWARSYGSGVVLTGHSADDSVETVLLHLLRGSGLDGLGGLREREQLSARALGEPDDGSPPLTVVRPLLAVTRAETLAYCEARGLPFLTDETNADPRMLRNRVRVHLLPVLRTYNPSIDSAISRLAASAQADEAWMSAYVVAAWRRLAQSEDGLATVALRSWRRQPVAVQRRLVRHAAELAGCREVGFDAVERALAVASADGPPRAELGGGLMVERVRGQLRFVQKGGESGLKGRGAAEAGR